MRARAAEGLLFTAESLAAVGRADISGRYFVVEGGVVSVSAKGEVMKWVPGEGITWETSLGSGVMAADTSDELLFALTDDLRITAINTSDGTTAWSLRLGCRLEPSDLLSPRGAFTARDEAVGVAVTLFGENGPCAIAGIYADGRNLLREAGLAGAYGDPINVALGPRGPHHRGGGLSYTLHRHSYRQTTGDLYTYLVPIPYGAIVVKHEK